VPRAVNPPGGDQPQRGGGGVQHRFLHGPVQLLVGPPAGQPGTFRAAGGLPDPLQRGSAVRAPGGQGEADLVQQRAQQPEPHTDVDGAAGQGDPSCGERFVGVAVQGGQRFAHRCRLRSFTV